MLVAASCSASSISPRIAGDTSADQASWQQSRTKRRISAKRGNSLEKSWLRLSMAAPPGRRRLRVATGTPVDHTLRYSRPRFDYPRSSPGRPAKSAREPTTMPATGLLDDVRRHITYSLGVAPDHQ